MNNGTFSVHLETVESSLRGGWAAEARLVWDDQHGRVIILRASEHGEEILGVRLPCGSGAVLEILGRQSPKMTNLPGWGQVGVESNFVSQFIGDIKAVQHLVESVRQIARIQYAAGLRAQAARVEEGYPAQAERVWEKREYASAREFLLRKVTPEARIRWD